MTRLSRRAALKGAASFAAFAPFTAACAPGSVTRASPMDAASTSGPAFVDGVRMAELIANGDMTALEAVDAAISRAESVEPQINAIANETFATARETAEASPEGVFAGVPSFTKDLMDRKGEPTLYGSRGFEGYVAPADAPFAAAWRNAGIVSLGKSTSPEMGLISSTEPVVTGATRNPWDVSRTPGGSSGGAAALAAARVVPFAHASDGGGSIRIPASCCGLFGLKPSSGLMAGNGRGDSPVDISVDHAVTWTVRDSAALLAMAQRPDSDLGPVETVRGPSTRRLKIAVAPDSGTGSPVDPSVRAGVEASAQLCRDLGHQVVDFSLPFDGAQFVDDFLLYWAAGAAAFAQQASEMSGKPIGPEILETWTLGLAASYQARADDMPAAIGRLQAFKAEYEAMFEGFDVLLSPTLGRPPVPIGEQDPQGDFDAVMDSVLSFAAFTAPMNVAGAASMSVPLHWTDDDLPVGIMFSGKRGDDALLLSLAYDLEAAKPWIGRVPAVSAS